MGMLIDHVQDLSLCEVSNVDKYTVLMAKLRWVRILHLSALACCKISSCMCVCFKLASATRVWYYVIMVKKRTAATRRNDQWRGADPLTQCLVASHFPLPSREHSPLHRSTKNGMVIQCSAD